MRADYPEKSGGDAVQVEAYARELRDLGWDVLFKPYRPAMAFHADEIVNLTNVDRTYEFLDAYRQARVAGARVFACPIHHALSDTRRMRRSMGGSPVRHALNTLLPEAVREAVVYLHRCVAPLSTKHKMRASVRLAGMVTHRKARVRAALDASERVFLLAAGEGRALARDYGWAGGNGELAPNGIELPGSKRPWPERAAGAIVCVGRVEPRKRQLELLKSADAAGVPITFIGALGTEHSYVEEFQECILSSASTWMGPLPRAKVQDELQSARALVNASWLEVQSLVDLEAAVNGCYVVSSPAGYSDEWLDDSVLKVSDWSTDSLVDAAREAASRDEGPALPTYARTWSETVETFTEAYLTQGNKGAVGT